MALFFITGVSGAGKSEAVLGLSARGYEAFDTDEDALARWQHVGTGYIHPKSSIKSEQRTQEFLKQHKWNVPREYIEDIAETAKDKPVFICGVADNIDELRDLFDTIFALVVDGQTLTARLASRTNNDWGKQPHELAQTLAAQKDAIREYGKLGYVMIDASLPKQEVVNAILKESKV